MVRQRIAATSGRLIKNKGMIYSESVMSGLVYAVVYKVPPPPAGGGQGVGEIAIFDADGSLTHPSIPSP